MGPVRRFLNQTVVPRSLFGRSLLIVILPIVVLQILLTVVFYNRHWDTVTRWLATGVAGEVSLLADQLEQAPDAAARNEVLQQFRRHVDLAVRLEADRTLAEATGEAGLGTTRVDHIDSKILEAFSEQLTWPFVVDLQPDQPDRVAIYVQLEDGLLQVTAARRRVTSTTTGLLLAWMVGASLVLVMIAMYFMNLQVRPIRRLAIAVDSFGKGRDPGDFPVGGPAEIRRAARAFNLMRERILRYLSQRTEMLAAVSHDLRTPLTRMRLELELMPDDADPVLAGLKSDVLEMEQLVESYLSFARGEGREAVEETPLAPILEGMKQRALRSGVKVEVEVDRSIVVPLRPLAFRRCLANLVDNACRYAGWIGISARRTPEHVEIAVEDDGPGIPPEYRDQVFQAFFRLDTSRSRETGGIGLGLTFARDVVLGHGGELRLDTSSRGGLKALVRLPA
ncbi:MAG TPA: ATP-binding protein [Geminicoccaceae bacterium]|nr:ATP-binding protein [Geminicoccaceae bacterium]